MYSTEVEGNLFQQLTSPIHYHIIHTNSNQKVKIFLENQFPCPCSSHMWSTTRTYTGGTMREEQTGTFCMLFYTRTSSHAKKEMCFTIPFCSIIIVQILLSFIGALKELGTKKDKKKCPILFTHTHPITFHIPWPLIAKAHPQRSKLVAENTKIYQLWFQFLSTEVIISNY